ncbi:MAG: ABC transporter substrate-binding protein [Bacteroidota bacterium]|nr:ABC transporter substrate-binding protein [Candidatus Kapabacteria bacterium]MCS7302452.1 ABC transporter substrate-binding protein [Candidatus Kapabacteria bacterium]MCX7936341.1 ABC transporter substrate-binding protein [Chlorobiota bacterium]MDW8074378.1 ABC transporter substrate-binding protein [Bacteroidota bacterium]MDW8271146.1 ABC transporter substrate-binding protein [Bacteroidota bacterium]
MDYLSQRITRVIVGTVIIVGVSMILDGCKVQDIRHSLRPARGEPRYGGTYRINMLRGNPNALDPILITSKLADDIALQLYDRLITFDSLLQPQPELARFWEISPDGLRYTFHLRTDVRFHDDPCFSQGKGRKMTAQDVVYSLTRACDPQARTTAFWVFKDKVRGATAYYTARMQGDSTPSKVEGIYALNDSTLIIELERPYTPFLLQLANAFSCVVPREAVEYYGENFFRHPVGTGPFRLAWWKDDYGMLLVRNEHYWQYDRWGNRLPYLDSVLITFVKDDKIQLRQFLDGQLDESYSIPTELFDVLVDPQTKKLRPSYRCSLQVCPALLTWFVDFNCAVHPFSEARLRQAICWAIDRRRLVQFVLRNTPYAPAHHGVTPPVLPGYDITRINGYAFDPQHARQLLAQTHFYQSGGRELTLHIYPEPRLQQVAEALQGMLAEHLGLNLRIETVQLAQFLDMAERGEFRMWGTRWYGDYPDVENYLSLFDGSYVPSDPTAPSYPNSTRYRNDTVSAILALATATRDSATRLSLYLKAEQVVLRDAPAAMLFYENHYRLIQQYVRNYPLDAMARPLLKHVWFSW